MGITETTNTAPCDDCGDDVPVPDDWALDWARCATCGLADDCTPFPNPPHDPEAIVKAQERSDLVAGLHAFADFLAAHPAVPEPHLFLTATYDPPALAQWLDGIEELELVRGSIDTYRNVVRRFGALKVELATRAEYLGDVQEVATTTTELVPLTPAEIIAKHTGGAS